jgi:hypothetical protein
MKKRNRIGKAGKASIRLVNASLEVRGRVPRTFFNWFDEQVSNDRDEKEMLGSCYFEEVGE